MTGSIRRLISCDVIVVVRDYKKFIESLKGMPTEWLRHKFITVLDMPEEDFQNFNSWYLDTRVKIALPDIDMIKAKKEHQGKTYIMQNVGLMAGASPFVLFHNEHDYLPFNVDRAIYQLYNEPDLQAIFGKSETFLTNGTPLETFPSLNLDGKYRYDCLEATRLFPSYADPLSAVFRRSVFDKVPFWDYEYNFKEFNYYHFILSLVGKYQDNLVFNPYTIKKARRSESFAGSITEGMKERLIHDIKLWLPGHPDGKYKEFQQDILSLIESGEITTFKEIDARIEDKLDSNKS